MILSGRAIPKYRYLQDQQHRDGGEIRLLEEVAKLSGSIPNEGQERSYTNCKF
jgi:hypothetical protein